MPFSRLPLAIHLLPLLAHGSAIPLLQKTIDIINPTPFNTTVPRSLFYELEELARIVDITYCVGTTSIAEPFQCASRCDDFPHFALIQTWNTGPLLSDSSGYMAYDHNSSNKRILVAFRGTYSISNTIADLSAMPQKYVPYLPENNSISAWESEDSLSTPESCGNCTVHAGFLSSWQNARDVIMPVLTQAHETHPDYKIHLVGHSLGGAVALLSSLEMQARGWDPTVTTFGEPRVGNSEFVAHVDDRFAGDAYRRVTHVDDPVTVLPPMRLGYRSHANEIHIARDVLPPELDDLRRCEGDEDGECSAAADGSRLWQLFFAHRDYFWRLGLCIKGGDPWDWKGQYRGPAEDEL